MSHGTLPWGIQPVCYAHVIFQVSSPGALVMILEMHGTLLLCDQAYGDSRFRSDSQGPGIAGHLLDAALIPHGHLPRYVQARCYAHRDVARPECRPPCSDSCGARYSRAILPGHKVYRISITFTATLTSWICARCIPDVARYSSQVYAGRPPRALRFVSRYVVLYPRNS